MDIYIFSMFIGFIISCSSFHSSTLFNLLSFYRNMSRHAMMGCPDPRLEMMELTKQAYSLV